jgi:hypothetical protein
VTGGSALPLDLVNTRRLHLLPHHNLRSIKVVHTTSSLFNMFGDAYVDTYKQYKIGTQRVVQSIAEASGYTTGSNGKRNGLPAKVNIPSHKLPEPARQVVKVTRSRNLPDNTLPTLRDVIAARGECAEHHKDEQQPMTRSSPRKRTQQRSRTRSLRSVYIAAHWRKMKPTLKMPYPLLLQKI